MVPRRRPRSGILAGPLVLGGLGPLALVLAAALLWSEGRPAAWAALTIAALFGVRIGREVATRRRGELLPNRWVGAAPIALLSGLGFLLPALLR